MPPTTRPGTGHGAQRLWHRGVVLALDFENEPLIQREKFRATGLYWNLELNACLPISWLLVLLGDLMELVSR